MAYGCFVELGFRDVIKCPPFNEHETPVVRQDH